jgi:uncharacterized protein (DUF58 family)
MAITGRLGFLAALASVFVGVLAPSWWGILAVLALLAVAAGMDLVLSGRVDRLRIERGGDRTVRLGETADSRVILTNTGDRRVRGWLRDAWPPSAGAAADRHRMDVPPGDRRIVTTVLRPTRRGDRHAASVTVRSTGPFGLAARQRSRVLPWTVRVLPPFGSRKHLPSRLARLRELDGRRLALIRGQGTEFDSLRDYVPGDDVRAIDWRATARRQAMVVRTWRPERDRHVLIVLDTARTAAGRVGDAPRLDAAMDAALLLAALAARAGDRVDLLAYDRQVRASVQAVGAPALLPALVDAMATLEPELVELDVRGLLSAIVARARHRALVVLLTSLDAAAAEQGLLTMLDPLVRRHQLLVASVADPRVEDMATGRGDAEAVYDAAAAERTRAERQRVAEQLTRHGAEVVDAPPEDLPPRLADRYLALKATGRL